MRSTFPSSTSFSALGTAVCAILGSAVAPSNLDAQDVEALGARRGTRPPEGYYREIARNPRAFQFRKAWLERARRVFEVRERARLRSDIRALNAGFPGGIASRAAARSTRAAVAGTFRIPVLLGGFSNVPSTAFDSAAYASKLFGATPPRPYSVTTYYDEVSRSMVTVTGDVVGWFAADSADTYYEGTNNCLDTGTDRCGEFLQELFVHYDSILDFGAYDNDGPDGVPNSGDDDGIVDFVAIIHPETGGECGGTNIWSHRFFYSGWPASGGAPYTTGDARAGGGSIMIDDYIIQGGLGGPSACSPDSIMPIGTFTHETGHAFGLPDLYDTSVGSFGAGYWDLMATVGLDEESPAHMSAWSLQQLGWVAVDTLLGGDGFRPFDIRPVQTSDTVFALCTSTLPAQCLAEEHFLLENRQLSGSDSTSLPGTGLLIWHVDPVLIGDCSTPGTACWLNTVNVEHDPAYDLEEADGLRHLNDRFNLGDAGDPFPGTSSNSTFGPATTPASVFNDSSATNILVDSISQNPDLSIHVAINFIPLPVAIVTDSVLPDGTMGAAYNDTLEASGGNGSYVWSLVGGALPPGLALDSLSGILSGVPEQDGDFQFLVQATSDTLSATKSFSLQVDKPALLLDDVLDDLLTSAAPLSDADRRFLDLLGNNNGSFDVGDLRAWLIDTGRLAAASASSAEATASVADPRAEGGR